METPVTPTPYRVSTITCNGIVGTSVNLSLFFQNVDIQEDVGFIYAEYKGTQHRGKKAKEKRSKKKEDSQETKEKKCFDNQVTVIYRLPTGHCPNIKLFRNGNIQMTGIRTEEEGQQMVEDMATELRRIYDTGITDVVDKIDSLGARDFKIRMINSNFSASYRIRRKDLHKLLISSKYGNTSNFQATSYPGVKLYYYWNNGNSQKDGVCRCVTPCYGKGTGNGDGECKKVTVSVFESGNVLITGANHFAQVNEAYAYICNILVKDVHVLKKTVPSTDA